MSVLKGTTNLGFHFNGGTMIAVDSKITNVRITGNVTSDLLVTDSERKYFELSSKALIVCTFMGLADDWDGMYLYVKEMDPTSVKEAVDLAKWYMAKFMDVHKHHYMVKYLNDFDDDVSFGTLIAGYDDNEGFQLWSLILEEDPAKVDLATLGSGAWAAQKFMEKMDYKNLTKKDASDSAFRGLLESAVVDRYSGGIFHVLHLRKDGFSIAEANFLDVYYECYDSLDIKGRTLFLLHPLRARQDEIVGDEFIQKIWRPDGLVTPRGTKGYLYHVEVARKRDFNFYHLVFGTSGQAYAAYQRISRPLQPEVTSFYTRDLKDLVSNYLACGSGGDKTIYAAKGTKALLKSICKAASS